MNIVKLLFIQSLALTVVLSGFNVFTADQSICHSGAKVLLYNDGTLQTCQLKNDYDINSIKCKANAQINFYSNGSLESCVLAQSTSVGMSKCRGNGVISFFMDGKLKSCIKPIN